MANRLPGQSDLMSRGRTAVGSGARAMTSEAGQGRAPHDFHDILDTLKRCTYHYSGAEVAQSVEHSTENAGVVSSILTLGTAVDAARRAGVAQW